MIVSRVRIYWLPHHWSFILKCKKTDQSILISRENFGLDICLCSSFDEAKEISSAYKLGDKSLKIQEWIFGWDHKTSYIYNLFKNGQDKAKEIWRKNYGMHNEYQNLGAVPLEKLQKDLEIKVPVVDPRVRHLTYDFNV